MKQHPRDLSHPHNPSTPRLVRLLGAVLAAVVWAGCASVPPSDAGATCRKPSAPSRWAVLDDDLRSRIAVERVDLTRDKHKRLVVRTAVRNLTDKDFTLQGQVVYILEDGTTDITAWQALPITANQIVFMTTRSFSSKAQEAVVQFRYMEREADPFAPLAKKKRYRY